MQSTLPPLSLQPYKTHNLDDAPSSTVKTTHDESLDMYRKMQTIRRLETSAGSLYKEKAVRGFCHLYSGQEAVAVGMKTSMRKQDSIISAYRVHGWTHLMGVSVEGVLAELTGRKGGCARGKGGSMHMVSVKLSYSKLQHLTRALFHLQLVRSQLLWRKWNCWRSSATWCRRCTREHVQERWRRLFRTLR